MHFCFCCFSFLTFTKKIDHFIVGLYFVITVLLECAGLLHGFPKGSLKEKGGKDTEVKESKGICCKVSHYNLGQEKTISLLCVKIFFLKATTRPMYLSICINHFIKVSAISEEVLQPNSDKM